MEKGRSASKYEEMTTRPVGLLILKNSGPTIMMMLISSMYNAADTFFVGKLGASATGAVGVAFPLMAIIQAVGFLFGQGAGNFVSRALGARKLDSAEEMAVTGFVSAFVFSAILGIFGIFNLDWLARILGSTGTILENAKSYLFYIMLGAPFLCSSLLLNNLLRYQGNAFYGMIGTVTGAILNICLDPIFIFVFKMGVSGAALATMLSQTVSFFILFFWCRRMEVKLRLRKFTATVANYTMIVKGGMPSLLRQSLTSIAGIVINRAAFPYGDAALASISIVNRIIMLAYSIMLGFGQGFQPVCGFNYGAKLYKRVKDGFWFCIRLSATALFALGILGFIFAPSIISAFLKGDNTVLDIGVFMLRLQCVTLPLNSWVVINNMMNQSMGRALSASIVSSSKQGIFQIPLVLILTPFLGILALQIAYPLADILSALLTTPFHIAAMRSMNEKAESDGALKSAEISQPEAKETEGEIPDSVDINPNEV